MSRIEGGQDTAHPGARLIKTRVVFFATGPSQRDFTVAVKQRRRVEPEESPLDRRREHALREIGRAAPDDEMPEGLGPLARRRFTVRQGPAELAESSDGGPRHATSSRDLLFALPLDPVGGAALDP